MMFSEKTILGRTGLKVGRLGISSSFGAPSAAYEAAFDRGCNYFTWGTFIRGRSGAMRRAIRNIRAKAGATTWWWPCSPTPTTVGSPNASSPKA